MTTTASGTAHGDAEPRFGVKWHEDMHAQVYGYTDDETHEFVPGLLQQGKRLLELQEQRDAMFQRVVTWFGRGIVGLVGLGVLNAWHNLGLSDTAWAVLKAVFGVK